MDASLSDQVLPGCLAKRGLITAESPYISTTSPMGRINQDEEARGIRTRTVSLWNVIGVQQR